MPDSCVIDIPLARPAYVEFISDKLRVLQMVSLTGSLEEAADQLVKNVIYRSELEQTTLSSARQQSASDSTDPSQAYVLDPVLETMDRVVRGIISGESIQSEHDDIRKYISNQQDRAELITNLLLTNDYRRLVSFAQIRNVLEKKLLTAASRSDLSVSEMMAFFAMVKSELAVIEGRVSAGSGGASDIMALLNKVDYSVQQEEAGLKKKFDKTTPAGREIVRRVIHKLRKIEKVSDT